VSENPFDSGAARIAQMLSKRNSCVRLAFRSQVTEQSAFL